MFKKAKFAFWIVVLACCILGTRVYLVDVPLWHFVAGGNGIDPATLHLSGEFVESNLGTAVDANHSFTVRMIAQQYNFVPQCVVAPAGLPVHFRITSADTAHTLSFTGTSFSLKAMPGEVNQASFTFPRTGDYSLPCHEFCGAGHYTMRGKLKVVSDDEFSTMSLDQRRTCETR
jgi:cytochrome c oxidase subunit 2